MIKPTDSRYSAVEYNTLLSHLAGTIQLMEPYEARDLFPWGILTKMVIQYPLKVEK